jgi:hypothetical protein
VTSAYWACVISSVLAVSLLVGWRTARRQQQVSYLDAGMARTARALEMRTGPQIVAAVSCPVCDRTGPARVLADERLVLGTPSGVLVTRQADAQFRCEHCGLHW